MTAAYDPLLVTLSLLVAIFASFTALQLASRLQAAQTRTARICWNVGGAMAMGGGIWSMHFVGMLAMNLPIELTYDPMTTLGSAFLAIGASSLALLRLGVQKLTVGRLCSGGALMGGAITGMHYLGMHAIQVAPGIEYDWTLVAVSAGIAVSASTAALWLMFRLAGTTATLLKTFGLRAAAACVMGAAICGMHYTGMAAAKFADGSLCVTGIRLDHLTLVFGITVSALVMLASTIAISVLDAYLSNHRRIAALLSRENRELAHRAKHDHLTGLPNRSSLEETLQQAIVTAQETSGEFALLFLDLDGFKQVNDTAGHSTGDWLLQQVAQRLTACVPAGEFVSRVSGDEFVLLVRDQDDRALEALCEQLLQTVAAPLELNGRSFQVSVSIGVAVYPVHDSDMRTLLIRADTAMYAAKKAGKNVYRFADIRGDIALTREMTRGLHNGEFELYFQPTVDAHTGSMRGAEALVRWNHPTRGLVSPADFIPVAEESGFIVPLGDWIFDQVCEKLSEWQRAGHPYTMAVNLSAVQLEDETLPSRVAQVIHKHGITPGQLVVEVTETFAMADVGRCERVLAALRNHGVLVAMDDFGTGYSSLSHLYRLPVDELKIDRAFIRELPTSEHARRICEGIVALAHSLKLKVVAEGVETHEQQVALANVSCDLLQGYHFARPMPWDQLTERIAATDGVFAELPPLRLAA